MRDIEAWLTHYKSQHTWEETVREILHIYECSAQIDRSDPYKAFIKALDLLYDDQSVPITSEDKAGDIAFSRIRDELNFKWKTNVTITLSCATVTKPGIMAKSLMQALMLEGSLTVTAKDIAKHCKVISEDMFETLMYFTGLTLTRTEASVASTVQILLTICYGLIYYCNKFPKVQDVPIAGNSKAPATLVAIGQQFFGF